MKVQLKSRSEIVNSAKALVWAVIYALDFAPSVLGRTMNVRNYNVEVEELLSICERWRNAGIRILANGGECICPMPDGPGWLHILCGAASADALAQARTYTYDHLPDSVYTLLSAHNGMRLFGDTLNVYGIIADFSRDPLLPIEVPLSLEHVNSDVPIIRRDLFDAGFAYFASLSIKRNIELYCSKNDDVLLFDRQIRLVLARPSGGVIACLKAICASMGKCFDERGHVLMPLKDLEEAALRSLGIPSF